MAHDNLVVVRRFANRVDADLARGALEAADIDAIVRSDDAAGLRPAMTLTNGVDLIVRAEDADRANEILDV